MSDDIDPEQPGQEAPKRRGRPTLFNTPLTQAERARRYRKARQWNDGDITECRDAVLMDRLRWALKNKETSDDAKDALDIYLEELIRRHHSKGALKLK